MSLNNGDYRQMRVGVVINVNKSGNQLWLGVAKRAEPAGPTRLTRNFLRAGVRFSARYLKLARPAPPRF
jgi:hypothetical protein